MEIIEAFAAKNKCYQAGALLTPRVERDIRDVLAPYALSEGLNPS